VENPLPKNLKEEEKIEVKNASKMTSTPEDLHWQS